MYNIQQAGEDVTINIGMAWADWALEIQSYIMSESQFDVDLMPTASSIPLNDGLQPQIIVVRNSKKQNVCEIFKKFCASDAGKNFLRHT